MTDPATLSSSPERINLVWLVRLRWATIALQLAIIGAVAFLLPSELPLGELVGLVAIELLTNVAAFILLRRSTNITNALIAGIMAFDVALITRLLYLTGGPTNPFGCVYLVQIALAAIVLPPRWAWALVALALAGSATLFFWSRPLVLGGSHAHHMDLHMQGMWVSFGVAATFIVYFLMRVTRALTDRDAELTAARQREVRQERLASLARLAAGAAHELATPLATIAVVAHELELRLSRTDDLAVTRDIALVRTQVDRCREILEHMAADAGEPRGEAFTDVDIRALVAAEIKHAAPAPPVRLVSDPPALPPAVRAPARALGHALRALIKNAQEAASSGEAVNISIAQAVDGRDSSVVVEVRDSGVGMAPDVLRRMGEPFFTTKGPGAGMGLGVFLARAVIEQAGGRLRFESAPGAGTRAVIRLPRSTGGANI